MDLFQTIVIAIVEGLTEFLPVSSTGHMIITQNLLGVQPGDPFVHAFTFIIQFVGGVFILEAFFPDAQC